MVRGMKKWSPLRKNKYTLDYAEEDPEKWGKIHIGSFLFWCDVISTASLLFEISYINRSKDQIQSIDIELDPYGIPVCMKLLVQQC